jgi:hypothetical protein
VNSEDLVESEPASARNLNPELAEKDARELQESYETALRGEGDDENGDGEVEEGDDGVVDDDDDRDGDPSSAGLADGNLMDVDGPGLFRKYLLTVNPC